MAHRLSAPLRLYRIAKSIHPIFDGMGGVVVDNRWNKAGHRVVYVAEHLALAMLEVLVHAGKKLPDDMVHAAMAIPAGIEWEDADIKQIPDWRDRASPMAQAYGSKWLAEGDEDMRPPLLRVPSVVVPQAFNYLVNPDHPVFDIAWSGSTSPVEWDLRLKSLLGSAGS